MTENLKQNVNQTSTPETVVKTANESMPAPEDKNNLIHQLKDALKGMLDASARANRTTENSFYKQAQSLFTTITGEDLAYKADLTARDEIVFEGYKILSKNNILSKENFEKELGFFKFRQQALAVERAWSLVSDEEKKQYGGDPNAFIARIEKKCDEFKKHGLDISKEIFCNIIANGYMLLDSKKKFLGGRIQIPVRLFSGAYKFRVFAIKDFADSVSMMQSSFDLTAQQTVQDKLNKKLLYSKNRFRKRKLRKARELIEDLIKQMDLKQKPNEDRMKIIKTLEEEIRTKIQKQVENEEREALEKITEVGEVGVLRRLKDFAYSERQTAKNIMKDIRKLEKNLEKDIKDKNKSEKKIGGIINKQIKKRKISKRKSSYIRTISKKERREEEKTLKNAF